MLRFPHVLAGIRAPNPQDSGGLRRWLTLEPGRWFGRLLELSSGWGMALWGAMWCPRRLCLPSGEALDQERQDDPEVLERRARARVL